MYKAAGRSHEHEVSVWVDQQQHVAQLRSLTTPRPLGTRGKKDWAYETRNDTKKVEYRVQYIIIIIHNNWYRFTKFVYQKTNFPLHSNKTIMLDSWP